MQSTNEKLEYILSKADEMIEKEVIILASYVLKNNKQIDEFIMAMGSFFFTKRGKKNCHFNYSTHEEINSLKGGKELFDFIIKWDNQFKVTGGSLRFSLHSEIKRNW